MNLFKFYSLFILFFLLNGKNANACVCSMPILLEQIPEKDFIARAKIISLSPDPEDSEYHKAEIEILKLYKGKPIKQIRVWSVLNSSCSFLPDEGSEWLIFASKNNEGQLGFGFCSGSLLIDRKFDEKRYPGITEKYLRKINLKIQVLDFLVSSKLEPKNEAGLNISSSINFLSEYKGSGIEGDRFALYELSIDTNLSIEAIKPIKEFTFSSSNGSLIPHLKQDLKVWSKDQEKTIAKPQKMIIAIYYYPAEGEYESFLSLFDL